MEHNTIQTRRFAPKKNLIFPLSLFILNFCIIFVIQAFFGNLNVPLVLFSLIFITLAFGYYLWQWFGTYYELRNGELFYRSGFTKGSIPVSSIRKIETHTRSWANTNAAIAWKGMMITYNKWDELFIAPKDEAGFLEAIQQINPDIEIKDHDKPEKMISK